MRLPPRVLLAATAVLVPSVSSQQFVNAPGVLNSGNIWTDGVALVDVDDDGDNDILFANGSSYGSGGFEPQHLFLNDGSGVFTAAHGNLNIPNRNMKMVIAEDFDNDGDPDLMYAPEGPFPNPNQFPRMLINDGNGVFSDESAARLPAIPMASFCVCAGDVDNDGDLDVVFTDGATFGGVPTQARLYLNDGSGFFTNATATNLPNDTYNAQDVILLDFDGDFDIDIALSGKGQNGKRGRLWLNDGSGNFSISPAMNQVGTGQTYEVDWGDMDGDSDMDGLVQSITSFNEGWARNDGPAVAMPEFTFSGSNGSDDNEMAAFDFDNDHDVLIGSLGGSERFYRNNGGGNISFAAGIIQGIGDSTLDLAVADLNGDGAYDIVTGQGESGNWTNRVYFNTGPADTNPPVFMNVETPAVLGATETVFRAHIRDAVSDDGQISATMAFSYTTVDGGGGTAGSGMAFHQGGGMFRAAVPTIGSTTQIDLTWTATDDVGNSSMFGPVTVPSGPCAAPINYGTGELGSSGTVAAISSAGGLPSVSNPNFAITLSGGIPSTLCVLLESMGQASDPAAFGTLWVASPFVRIPNTTDGAGNSTYVVPSVPAMAGMTLYYEWVIRDAVAGNAQHSGGLEVTYCP